MHNLEKSRTRAIPTLKCKSGRYFHEGLVAISRLESILATFDMARVAIEPRDMKFYQNAHARNDPESPRKTVIQVFYNLKTDNKALRIVGRYCH